MTKQEALFNYCLRLADTSLILAQRNAEWCGHGPFLEEDLALTNLSLDLIGQANSIYQYAAQVEGKARNEDDLAYHRSEREFLNTLIAEQSNGDYAKTILRQFFCDTFDFYFYAELVKSKDETLSAIAEKSIKEITYHLRHTSSWVERLGDGTEESHTRMQDALNEIWRFTGEMFEMNEVDTILIKEGIAVDLNSIKSKWESKSKEILDRATIKIPANAFMQRGSREAKHTEHLGFILAEMQSLPRALPDAKW
ncbi:MAG: phenylacetate-CoA oxygenase subunit PaaI [Bacteroidetes bacterium]|nr:MAG: phenylacetate-CoA oxygenase subunit PaaI [Bacteroidota bacterium]